MCYADTYLFRCCGRRRVFYDEEIERCPQDVRADPNHWIIGRLIRARHPCPWCVRRHQREALRENAEYSAQAHRAKAVLEYLRGERATPLTDAEFAALPPGRQRRLRDLQRPQRELIDVAREAIQRWADMDMLLSQPSQPDPPPRTPSQNNLQQPANMEAPPLSFHEWVSAHQESPSPATVLVDLENYLEYIIEFQGEINYHIRFFDAVVHPLQSRYSVEYMPDDPSGRLMTYNTFVAAENIPAPETIVSLGEGVDRYARYLLEEGSLEHQRQFLNFREDVGLQLREYLNTVSPTGISFARDVDGSLQTFSRWLASNRQMPNPEIPVGAQLEIEIIGYEDYLETGAREPDLRMLRQFQSHLHRIRENELRTFDFHPHIEGIRTFRENLESQDVNRRVWNQNLQNYPAYLQSLGHLDLAERFQQARREHEQDVRRELEGHRTALPRRWELSLNPNLMTADELGDRFLSITTELSAHLQHLRRHPPEYIHVALLDLGTLVHNYRSAISNHRRLTSDEWDVIIVGVRTISRAFSHNNPHEPIFNPYNAPVAYHNILDDLSSGSPDDYVVVSAPRIEGQVGEQIGGIARAFDDESESPRTLVRPSPLGNRPPRNSPASDTSLELDPNWFSNGDRPPAPERPIHPDPDSILDQLYLADQARRDRNDRRRYRQQMNLRPLTPEIEDGQSEVESEGSIDMTDYMEVDQMGGWQE